MKKIVFLGVCLILFLMTTPSGVAHAASERQISKSFVVRNWKGEVEAPADEVFPDDEELPDYEEPPADEPEEIEPEKPADEPDAPVVDEPEEQGSPEEQDEPKEEPAEPDDDHTDEDEPLPADDETIPPAEESEVEEDEQDEPDDPDADEPLGSDSGSEEIEQSVPGSNVVNETDVEPEPVVETEGEEEVAPGDTEEEPAEQPEE